MLGVAAHALGILLDPFRLAILTGGVVVGLALGVIPGLGGVVGLALLIPFTYKLDSYAAFALLLGMASVTTISDLIPAILFGVPGSVGAAATVIDGHALAKQGQAGRALGAGYTAALMGGIFGALLLALTLPIVRPIILYLGTPELLCFCIFGLSMVAVLSGDAPLKGITAACFGLLLAMIGSGSQTGTMRWTFDTLYLWDHLPLIPFTLGLFAIPELAELAVSRGTIDSAGTKPDFALSAQWAGARDAFANWWLVLRCSWIGALLGAVPGLGAASIDWIVYGHALRTEKNGTFGRGDIRGVIAPEASNNAKEGGHLIPTIAFGVPAGASMAVLLGAFLLHGLVPGPDMLTKNLDVTFSMMWSLTLAHIIGALICLVASGLFARLAQVPASRLVPLVLVMMYVSALQGSQSWGDLYSLAIFGVIGWVMKWLGWPRPPLMLGFVLGALFERYLFISIEIYGAAWLQRPAVIVILAASAWVLIGPLTASIRSMIKGLRTSTRKAMRFDATIAFDVLAPAILLAALWSSWSWPWEAKLVPDAAIYCALIFSIANLLRDFFTAPILVATDGGTSDGGPHPIERFTTRPEIPTNVVRHRLVRYFAWIVAFLLLSTVIGFLPAIAVTVLLQSRFEFGQSWIYSLAASVVVTTLLIIVLDRTFHLAWPVSLLGENYPALRLVLPFI